MRLKNKMSLKKRALSPGQNLNGMDLGATEWFSTRNPWIGNPAP